MKTLFAVLFLSTLGLAQSLPDAPSATVRPYQGTVVHNTVTFKSKAESRHPKRLLALAAVNAYAVIGDLKDIRTSEELFHEYGYVEGNTFLVGLHPTAGAYYKRDFGLLLPALNIPSIVGYFMRKPTLYYMGLTGPATFGTIHLKQGYDNETTLHEER
jgi:hypothetical protein